VGADEDSRRNRAGPSENYPEAVLANGQPGVRPARTNHLYPPIALLFAMSGFPILPTGWGEETAVIKEELA